MSVFDLALGEAARLVVRATDTLLDSPTTTSSDVQSPQTSRPTGTNQSNENANNGNSGGSSPLLFFVALGFGVVFTNLWIIVGVKYCFRYNARNRARMTNEDGDPINLETVQRPHRRRREKKLMSMDEVNQKFPMKKYKTWMSERAREGLPTAGGVSVAPSRSNSIRDADGIAGAMTAKDLPSIEGRRPSDPVAAPPAVVETVKDAEKAAPESGPAPDADAGQKSGSQPPETQRMSSEDEDDDDHIDAALPPECLGAPGDTCAICIDGLEDDDDVRGLTCGHAFHAVCVDPRLTSRRACCPLCKADYYTPKPRPNPDAEAATANTTNPPDAGSRHPATPLQRMRAAIYRFRNPDGAGPTQPPYPPVRRSRTRSRGVQTGTATSAPGQQSEPAAAAGAPHAGMLSSIRQKLRLGRRRHSSDAAVRVDVTPSQLEAGRT